MNLPIYDSSECDFLDVLLKADVIKMTFFLVPAIFSSLTLVIIIPLSSIFFRLCEYLLLI